MHKEKKRRIRGKQHFPNNYKRIVLCLCIYICFVFFSGSKPGFLWFYTNNFWYNPLLLIMSAIYVVKAVLQELKLKWELKKKLIIKEFSKKAPNLSPHNPWVLLLETCQQFTEKERKKQTNKNQPKIKRKIKHPNYKQQQQKSPHIFNSCTGAEKKNLKILGRGNQVM